MNQVGDAFVLNRAYIYLMHSLQRLVDTRKCTHVVDCAEIFAYRFPVEYAK